MSQVFAISVSGRVGAPVSGGSGGTPPPPPPPAPPPADTTPPVISNIAVTGITTTNATISWTTNEASSSFVDYGATATYGRLASSATSTTSHSVNLSGLTAATIYHFRVRSADASGNESFSLDQTFETLAAADTTPPTLSSVRATNITENSATIEWTTNELADSRVDFGLTNNYEIGSVSSSTLLTSHSFGLINLTSGTLYHFRVRSADAGGNANTSSDFTFTTLDSTPPIISNVAVSNIGATSAQISWTTNELTRGRIIYTRAGGLPQTQDGLTPLQEHSIVLNNLAANSNYGVVIRAEDGSGNEAFADTSFTTLRDRVPPANVSNLQAASGDGNIVLSWINPQDVDFSGIRIQRSIENFPLNPTDGQNVFDGVATNFTNKSLQNGTRHFYTVFAYDTSVNFSSGALARATPQTAEVAPPATGEALPSSGAPSGAPAESVPGGAPSSVGEAPLVPPPQEIFLKLDNFLFFTAGRTIVISTLGGQIKLLPNSSLSITFASQASAKAIGNIILSLADSLYLLKLNERGQYLTDIVVPETVGSYDGAIKITYTDKSSEELKFIINIAPKGFIFAQVDGTEMPLTAAKVTLYELSAGGEWQIWNAADFKQNNPQITNEKGEYGFLLPRGIYHLVASRDGYRENRTARFIVEDIVANLSMELLLLPPKITDVIKLEATIVTNVANVAKNIGQKTIFASKIAREEIAQFAKNPAVEQTTEVVVAPAVTAVAAANTITAISVTNLWRYLYYLFTQPLVLLRRRKRVTWGIVYNAYTRVPVDLAIVRLYQLTNDQRPTTNDTSLSPITPKLVQTRVTDKQGRFVFLVEPGTYKIEVTKQDFKFPTEYLATARDDDPYMNLYHGEEIEAKEAAELTPSIPLDSVTEEIDAKKLIARQAWRGAQKGLAWSGIVLAATSFAIVPSRLTGLFLILHLMLYMLFKRLAEIKKPKKWGIVYDEQTRQPIKHAVARIFETQYNKLLGSQITDSTGRYGFLGGKNSYYLTFEKAGYAQKKSDILDLREQREIGIVAVDAGLSANSSLSKPEAMAPQS